jgi:hypothetical protein
VEPVRFTPREPGDGKFADTLLRGLRFSRADRAHGDPIRDALRLLRVIGELQPASLRIDSVGLARRLGVRPWPDGARWIEPSQWSGAVRAFQTRRRPYLLYR